MSRRLPLLATALAVGGLVLPGASGAASASPALDRTTTATSGHRGATDIAVSFQVRNVNRSKLPCHADGKTYTVNGHLVAPRGSLSHGVRMDAVTLYLHGLGVGQFFWRFRNVPGYDHAAAQARAGHASVVIDRLGYDLSGKPYGKKICLGARADIAHQIITDLRTGHYSIGSRPAVPRFAKVTRRSLLRRPDLPDRGLLLR